MSIIVPCSCGQKLAATPQMMGRIICCPKCSRMLTVGSSQGVASEVASAGSAKLLVMVGIGGGAVVAIGGIGLIIYFALSGRAPAVPVAGAPGATPSTQSLTEARKNFNTKLVRKESARHPLPQPPPQLFRTIHFDSPIGKLAGYLSPNPNDGKKHPAIIWITGGDSSTIDEGVWRDSPASNDQTASAYRKAGIIMMFPTLRGGNENPGFHEGFYGEVDDILSAADFLAKQDFVDAQRIYLGGHSSGGTMVLLTAEWTARFRAVFSFGPTDDIRKYQAEFHVFDTSDQREFDLRAPGRWLNSIRAPAFVFEGGTGQSAVRSLETMARASTNPQIHFFAVTRANHFDILDPTNRLIAQKILRDDGTECNIAFSQEELKQPFAR